MIPFDWAKSVQESAEETPCDAVLCYRIDPVTQRRHICVVTKEIAVIERLERVGLHGI